MQRLSGDSLPNSEIVKNVDGTLYFDGCNTLELAKEYGTPLYVYSETDILSRIEEMKECFRDLCPTGRIAYTSKAFTSVAMMKICREQGICVEVVSGGELHIAKAAGMPGERIEFNGNNKTFSEIEDAVLYDVGRFIVDGLTELSLIEEACIKHNKKAKVLLRITPGVAADTHDHLVTGKKDSKFGIPLDEEIFLPQIKHAIDSPYIEFMGLHFHVGSQLFDVTPYMKALEILLDTVGLIRNEFGVTAAELNLGGGFGATYTDEDRKPYRYFLAPMIERIQEYYEGLGEDLPVVIVEPGRSIVAQAGITLYTIGQIKDIPGLRKFVSVDGGMGDNIRPALYQSVYHGVIANKLNLPETEVVTISGKNCESGDILIKDIPLPLPETGDIFCIFSTGAYGFSMASNYNCNLIPPVVLCKDGTHRLIVKGQSYEQLVENHIL